MILVVEVFMFVWTIWFICFFVTRSTDFAVVDFLIADHTGLDGFSFCNLYIHRYTLFSFCKRHIFNKGWLVWYWSTIMKNCLYRYRPWEISLLYGNINSLMNRIWLCLQLSSIIHWGFNIRSSRFCMKYPLNPSITFSTDFKMMFLSLVEYGNNTGVLSGPLLQLRM